MTEGQALVKAQRELWEMEARAEKAEKESVQYRQWWENASETCRVTQALVDTLDIRVSDQAHRAEKAEAALAAAEQLKITTVNAAKAIIRAVMEAEHEEYLKFACQRQVFAVQLARAVMAEEAARWHNRQAKECEDMAASPQNKPEQFRKERTRLKHVAATHADSGQEIRALAPLPPGLCVLPVAAFKSALDRARQVLGADSATYQALAALDAAGGAPPPPPEKPPCPECSDLPFRDPCSICDTAGGER